MKMSLDLRTGLSQTLTPQQIQYLKLLQLPIVQLEQQVRQEIEENPILEEFSEEAVHEDDSFDEYASPEETTPVTEDYEDYTTEYFEKEPKKLIDDDADPFEFYKMVWQDDSDYGHKNKQSSDEDEPEHFQIKDTTSFIDDMTDQLRMLDLKEEDFILGEQIIGNVESDGYLRRELEDIVDETNIFIAELNLKIEEKIVFHAQEKIDNIIHNPEYNPAREYNVSRDVLKIVKKNLYNEDIFDEETDDTEDDLVNNVRLLNKITLSDAEKMLTVIQNLDPPGIASRNLRECLLAQCKSFTRKNAAQKLALEILENYYEPFSMKHYHVILKQLEVTEDYLREAIEFIRKLNPKPGGGDTSAGFFTIIPDFLVEKDEETDELCITVNDSRIPTLKLSTAYEKIKKESKYKVFNKETREWIRNKYEEAKFLIQAIRQRKATMLKVMTAICGLQKDFFYEGHIGLKPLIYKDVAETTGLDISTVCRIVNQKYVVTEFGTFELKFFFSESLPNEDGEEVSTRIIKQALKEIIDAEPKSKPYSDDKIADLLKEKGYLVARRTIAKYREQLKLPVARLRKEL
jgi:RNA polymerase sigma-54 factor